MNQQVFGEQSVAEVMEIVKQEAKLNEVRLLVVCGTSCQKLPIVTELQEAPFITVFFQDFKPNPTYENVKDGIRKYLDEGCNVIMAIGGGSAMDVAKCIDLFAPMDASEDYLEQLAAGKVPDSIAPFVAIPTTAGTGSEATRFAVIYKNGEKQSVAHNSIVPAYVLMRPGLLATLPEYQRKATALDALGHAVESMWSVNSTEESKQYSVQAIEKICQFIDGYIRGDVAASAEMLLASNLAGKAINITQTTAGHAMCYKITSLYGCSHGHAVALVLRKLWPFMLQNISLCIDPRGEAYLRECFEQLAKAFGKDTMEDGAQAFIELFERMELDVPKLDEEKLQILASSVNPTRLKNNPVQLDRQTIEQLYKEILN